MNYRKILVFFEKLTRPKKITIKERAEHLFIAYSRITGECSPMARAKVFTYFKEMVNEDFKAEETVYENLAKKNNSVSNQCKRAIEWINK